MNETKLDQIYPLGEKRPDLVKTPTGKNLNNISIENIISGNLQPEDCRISSETLEQQAQIAELAGNPQMAQNFRRAAELTAIPDEEIIRIYNALRPYRSTKEQLLKMAGHIETQFQASENAAFLREAAEYYEKRNRLKNINDNQS
jgi:propanediol dehydratase small subunit